MVARLSRKLENISCFLQGMHLGDLLVKEIGVCRVDAEHIGAPGLTNGVIVIDRFMSLCLQAVVESKHISTVLSFALTSIQGI